MTSFSMVTLISLLKSLDYISENIIHDVHRGSTLGLAASNIVANPDSIEAITDTHDKQSNSLFDIKVENNPIALAVNNDTNVVYVANRGSNTISVIDNTKNAVVANVTVDGKPTSISLNPHTNMIYVAYDRSNVVSVIDATKNAVVANHTDKRTKDDYNGSRLGLSLQ